MICMSYVMGRYERTTLWLVRNNKTNNTFPEREFIKEKICVTQPKDTQRRPNMEREKHDDV